MTSPPPFLVRGNDGSDYPADAAAIAAWLREGRIGRDQLVFIIAENRWVRARELAPRTSLRLLVYAGGGCLGVVLLIAILGSVSSWVAERAQKKSAEAGRAAIRREREERERQLHRDAPQVAARIREQMPKVVSAEKSDPIMAVALLGELRPVVAPYLDLKPVPDVLAEPLAEYRAATERATNRKDARELYDLVLERQASARTLIEQANWSAADEAISRALISIDALEKNPETPRVVAKGEKRVPELKAALQKDRQQVEPYVVRQRRDAEVNELLMSFCGSKPVCNAWDGECGNIESALKRRAHDPGSIDVENCTDPVLYERQCWVTTCDVRGKNAFGALVLQRKKFSISKLGVEEIR